MNRENHWLLSCCLLSRGLLSKESSKGNDSKDSQHGLDQIFSVLKKKKNSQIVQNEEICLESYKDSFVGALPINEDLYTKAKTRKTDKKKAKILGKRTYLTAFSFYLFQQFLSILEIWPILPVFLDQAYIWYMVDVLIINECP